MKAINKAFAIVSHGTVYAVILADSPGEAADIFGGKLVLRPGKKLDSLVHEGEMILSASLFYGINSHDDGEGYEVYDSFEWYCQDEPTGIKAFNHDFEKNYGLIVGIKEIPSFRLKLKK